MRLTFENRKFILERPSAMSRYCDAPKGEWIKENAFTFSTRNIKDAARLRSLADSKAENIIKKHMLIDYALPSGGVPTPEGLELYDFQKHQGVPHILSHSKAYLAHSPGLGKTPQAVSAVSAKPGRALIIVPSFLKVVWARMITEWFIRDFPSISIVPNLRGVNYQADFVIVSDAMLRVPPVLAALLKEKFRYVFIDEGHRFKTPDASRTIALFGGRSKKLTSPGLIYNSEHVCMLSGTPMLNRPIELWPVLFAMAPELINFMSYEEFGFRYCGATRNEYGWDFLGSSNADELRLRIMGRFMQYLKKEDVLKDLPLKIREVIPMDKDPRDKDVIDFDKEMLKRFSRNKDKKPELGEYAEMRHVNGLAKVNWSAAFVKDILENDESESILLFAHHRDVVSKAAALLSRFKPKIINGGVKSEERTLIEDEFQKGKCRLIIGNIDAMNLGLTLTRATRVIFIEYAWTPALNEQAEDRANRIGSKWSVYCQYIVLPGSIDEDILTSNILKQQIIERVIA